MIVDWTTAPTEPGWYLRAPQGLPMTQARPCFINRDLILPQQNDDDWYLGPITGFPTTTHGIIDA